MNRSRPSPEGVNRGLTSLADAAAMELFECDVALDGPLPPCDAKIVLLHRYWCSIRPAGLLMPGRQHFDPADVPLLLPTIRLYDVHREPWRFRLVRILGRDPTGSWFDPNDAKASGKNSYDNLVLVAEGRGISYRRGFPLHFLPDKNHLSSERILLPLARNGCDVDIVLGLTVHHPVQAISRTHRTAVA
jgi:hypothetical protein